MCVGGEIVYGLRGLVCLGVGGVCARWRMEDEVAVRALDFHELT